MYSASIALYDDASVHKSRNYRYCNATLIATYGFIAIGEEVNVYCNNVYRNSNSCQLKSKFTDTGSNNDGARTLGPDASPTISHRTGRTKVDTTQSKTGCNRHYRTKRRCQLNATFTTLDLTNYYGART